MQHRSDVEHSLQDALVYAEFSSINKTKLPNGLQIEYALHGDSNAPEKVLLIMGLASEKEAWLAFLAAFFRYPGNRIRYQIATLDNRGVGGTDAPFGRYTTSQMAQDTIEFIDHLGWSNVHVAGMSMGGMIAQELTLVAPNRIRSLALLVTSPGFLESIPPEAPQLSAYARLLGNFMTTTVHQRTMNLLHVLYPSEYLKDRTIATALYTSHFERIKVSRTRLLGILGQYAAVMSHRMDKNRLQKLRDMNIPILIVGAEKDRLLHVSHSTLLGKRLASPTTCLVLFKTSGHGLHIQHRTDVVNELSNHFRHSRL